MARSAQLDRNLTPNRTISYARVTFRHRLSVMSLREAHLIVSSQAEASADCYEPHQLHNVTTKDALQLNSTCAHATQRPYPPISQPPQHTPSSHLQPTIPAGSHTHPRTYSPPRRRPFSASPHKLSSLSAESPPRCSRCSAEGVAERSKGHFPPQ